MFDMVKDISYNSNLFNLKIRQTRKVTAIDMQLHTPMVNTCDIPGTLEFLQQNYPGVLKTQCFNDKNLPFITEVVATEIGHLFEHILIDQLCALKIKQGAGSAVFNGNTSWNWQKNPYGLFEIWIDIGKKELILLIEALKRTIELTKKLLQPVLDFLIERERPGILRATI